MPMALSIRDETTLPGGEEHVFELAFPTESITVRDLIRERVYQEVEDYNRAAQTSAPAAPYRGLVQPGEAERKLNPTRRPKSRKEIDWKKQLDVATEAYERRQFLVLLGSHQTESLDETIMITRGTEVTFLRLVPLVGG